MKRATLSQIQKCRLQIISNGSVPSATLVAHELGAEFSPASIVLGLRQIESSELRHIHVPERNLLAPHVEETSRYQFLRARLSATEKLVAELKARIVILERRERTLNRDHIKSTQKLAKSQYRNRDYRGAMSRLSTEIVALEMALTLVGGRWGHTPLSVSDFAKARINDDKRTQLFDQSHSLLNQVNPITSSAELSAAMSIASDSLYARLLNTHAIQQEHKYLMYDAIRQYHLKEKKMQDHIKNLEQQLSVLTQNQRRMSGAFNRLWPHELLKST